MLIGRHHRLPDGRHVRLRLPLVRDATQLAALCGCTELDARRLLRADVLVCALAWDGAHEAFVGFAHLSRSGERFVCATDPEVEALVLAGLRERAADQRVA